MAGSTFGVLDTHVGPWTEDEFLGLPMDARIELLDGSLLVSPIASVRHQWVVQRTAVALEAVADDETLVLPGANIRLSRDRILIPDVVVIRRSAFDAALVDVADVLLAVEITSPGNAYVDRGLKPQLYAEAGVEHLVRIDLDRRVVTASAYVLSAGAAYREVQRTDERGVLRLDSPLTVDLDVAAYARG